MFDRRQIFVERPTNFDYSEFIGRQECAEAQQEAGPRPSINPTRSR
jgi:hypothetical protein